MEEFSVKDCALLERMSGLAPAFNLRELRDRIAAAGESVLYHHFCETLLRPTFDDPFYRNDFAVWASLRLRDQTLAERLGVIDPYSLGSLEELRGVTLEIIDERLSEVPMVPWAFPGQEFFFVEALTVVFDSGERIAHPRALAGAIRRMTTGAVYYHFLEARRREPRGKDDFTAWLEGGGGEFEGYRRTLGAIDFSFRSLPRLRETLVEVLEQVETGP